MTLAEQLARFHRIVTGADPVERAGELVESDHVDAATRLGVYVYAYVARIADVLAGDYPKLAATHEAFRALIAPYLRAYPPRHPSLREAGRDLARFLVDQGAPRHLIDLARIERARVEAFDGGADAQPLARTDLEALGPEAFPTLRLRLVPSAQLVELATNADDSWDAIESEREPPAPADGARTVLVWRRDYTVIHRTLEADEARVMRALVTGTTFAAACELLVELPDPAPRVVELLLRWLDAGVLVGG